MKNTKVILFSGKGRFGKDTSAAMLKNIFENRFSENVITIHFADALKMLCETAYGWIKGDKGPVGRTILQNVGTMYRSNNPTCWVNIVRELVLGTDADYVFIPDCRYLTEAQGFEDFDHFIIRIERPNFDNGLTEEQRAHLSEVELDNYDGFDLTISNSGTLEDLETKISYLANYIHLST